MVRISSKEFDELLRRGGKAPVPHAAMCDELENAVGSKASGHKRGVMNATEKRYYDEEIFPRLITGEYLWSMYEGMRFRIGKSNAFYCPDWDIMTSTGLQLHECKGGFSREASLVRIKAAAQQFPFIFKLCRYVDGRWEISKI